MIKLEVLHKNKGTTSLVFESRSSTQESLDELDEVYSALLGSRPRRGGYLASNRFEIEVQDDLPSEGS